MWWSTQLFSRMSGTGSAGGSCLRCAISAAPSSCTRNGWMKFMWPTWPIVGLSAASPVSTRLPPSRPAIQRSCRRSWLSATSRSTLTCRRCVSADTSGHGDPAAYRIPRRRRVGRGGKTLAERALAEHLRELGEQLEVLLGRVLRHEQHEHLVDRATVGRVERDLLR